MEVVHVTVHTMLRALLQIMFKAPVIVSCTEIVQTHLQAGVPGFVKYNNRFFPRHEVRLTRYMKRGNAFGRARTCHAHARTYARTPGGTFLSTSGASCTVAHFRKS